MKRLKVIATLLGICVTLPIWFYLMYHVLERVHATELMWFLFWVYMPFTMLISIVSKLVEGEK